MHAGGTGSPDRDPHDAEGGPDEGLEQRLRAMLERFWQPPRRDPGDHPPEPPAA